ncbi:MAG: N-acetyltransferase [Alphaproteobacteria bacterium]|nr:N-acetyltransferase [Alphaproteobacteria bacterium]MDE1985828.1 N-acetyltransferase [Alphaproteobacteria bacterium]MDE2163653.1 N-acetyltransferase [Alphaproteobacteria bacterium]MDE2266324.1 N-acetyltransferase [Alphaproteobacteria bacterium]MDE2498923.1 N-acetyltransferase [Alphaproteobacteria bacterium]
MTDVVIRRVERSDLPALLAIYNHYVVHTPVTFDVEPRTLAQRQVWLDTFASSGRYQCFVAARDSQAIGWACSGKFKEKAAYETSVETSIYLAPGEQSKGLGRKLYETLLSALAKEDLHRAFGGVTLPNEGSVGVHRALGFSLVGTYPEVGRKFGRFWDVAWFGRPFR